MYWKDILKRQHEKIHKDRQRLNKLQPKHKLGLAGVLFLQTGTWKMTLSQSKGPKYVVLFPFLFLATGVADLITPMLILHVCPVEGIRHMMNMHVY